MTDLKIHAVAVLQARETCLNISGISAGLGTRRAKCMGSIISILPSPSAHGVSNPSIKSGGITRTAQTILIKDSPIFGLDCRGGRTLFKTTVTV